MVRLQHSWSTGFLSLERMNMASGKERNTDESIPSIVIEEFGEADKPTTATET